MYIIYSQISVNYFVSIKMAGYGCNQQTTRKYEFSVDTRSLAVTENIDTFKGAKCGYDFKEKLLLLKILQILS